MTAPGYERCKECKGPLDKACPRPHLNVNHIDGPYIAWCSGQMRWLTLGERIRMFFGRLDIRRLKP